MTTNTSARPALPGLMPRQARRLLYAKIARLHYVQGGL